jgi:hypothetical protein
MSKLFTVIGVILLLGASVMFLHLSTTTEEYSRYNVQWNGTSVFYAYAEERGAREIMNLREIPDTSGAMLLIIAPAGNVSGEDLVQYRSFLLGGNTILLLDDFGTGNQLLEGIGSGIRILSGNLSGIDMEYNTPTSIIVYRDGNSSLLEGVDTLVLNGPAALEGGEALMVTSILSWIDVDGDGRISGDESLDKYGVMARETIGRGELYVFSDPSILINAMMAEEGLRDNRRFVDAVVNEDRQVYLDGKYSGTAAGGAVIALLAIVKSTIIIKIVLLCTLLLLVAYAFKKKVL